MTAYLPWPLFIIEESVMMTLAPYVMLKKRLLHICFSYAAFLELVGLDRILVCILLRSPINVLVQSWLKDYISSCFGQSLVILQSMFTVLWLIWNYRNKVLHRGLNPNPLEVIPTTKTLSCRYRNAYAGPFHPTRELRASKLAHLCRAISASHQIS